MAPIPSPLLPAGAVAAIDRLLTGQRSSVCTIQRPASGVDFTGAPTGGFTTTAVAVCTVRAPGRMPIESVGGGRFGAVVDYEVAFAPDVDVKSNDRIVVNGRTLQVIADHDAASHGFQLKVLAKAVES